MQWAELLEVTLLYALEVLRVSILVRTVPATYLKMINKIEAGSLKTSQKHRLDLLRCYMD